MKTIVVQTSKLFKDIGILIIMLGLLLSFTQLVKFAVLVTQDISELSGKFSYEKESIERGSDYYVYNTRTMTRNMEHSIELNTQAENLSNQIQSGQLTFVALAIAMFFAFFTLYFFLDFLIMYTIKFQPWSVIFLLLSFIFSVFYFQMVDLKETGNSICFMFTTMISIIVGVVLIAYILIFPNNIRIE